MEITLSREGSPLEQTLTYLDDLQFEVDELIVGEDRRVTAVLWVKNGEYPALDQYLQYDSSVGSVETLADPGDERLFRMEWTTDVDALVHLLDEGRCVVMDATGDYHGWELRLLFPEHGALGQAMESLEELAVAVDVRRVYDLSEERNRQYGLTECQAETLLTAFEAGYFQVPREQILEDVADELGISHQALSERLRRAHETLIAHTLADAPLEPDE